METAEDRRVLRFGLPPSLCQTIRARRRALGLSVPVAARRIGVSERAFWYWEQGERRPQPHHARQLVALLNLPGDVAELLDAACAKSRAA